MNMSFRVTSLAVALTVAGTPFLLSAQPNSPACLAVLHAANKMYTTPNHQFMSKVDALSGGTARKMESITTGGTYYVMASGRWVKGPVPSSPMEEMLKENPQSKVVCREVRSESVNGAAATVYTVHNQTEYGIVDAQYWIAHAGGLILRSETDIDVGVKNGKSHTSMRAEYTNVQAPKLGK
ncbi:MAG: hypothetical protein ABJB74_16755 [Gemmatimonas sp.]